MGYELTGTVKYVGELELVGAKQYPKRELWVEHGTEYPQVSAFELFGDKNVPKADGLEVGQAVTVHFDLRGREWSRDGKARVFNSLNAWKIDKQQQAAPDYNNSGLAAGDESDIPF